METYNGLVRTPTDAIILFEACRLGLLPRVQRRLSEKERQSIRSGSVFVWDEREAGMRRWTDGKSWSASRVSGSFLTYREMEGKRGGNSFVSPANRGAKTPDSNDDPQAEGEEGPDGYRYKPDGLMKQSFSITTSQGQHLHLISYYSRSLPAQALRQPSNDPNLSSIQPAKGMYPEATVNDQSTVPAVTRSPMPGAPNYMMAPSPAYGRPPVHHPHAYIPAGYIPHPAYIGYPLSPMPTPPPYAIHHYAAGPPGLPPLGYPPPGYGQPHPLHLNHAPPSSYDQRPLRASESGASQPQPAPTLHHRTSAPPMPYSLSQPPPPVSASYTPSQPPVHVSYPQHSTSTTATSQQQESYNHRPAHYLQIDPRLTAPSSYESQTNGQPVSPIRPAHPQNEAKPHENGVPVTASQAPTIGAMVNNNDAVAKPLAEEKSRSEREADRQGSSSPGGTKLGAPPQDIPSEKLGFREDKRALSMLDRAFARV